MLNTNRSTRPTDFPLFACPPSFRNQQMISFATNPPHGLGYDHYHSQQQQLLACQNNRPYSNPHSSKAPATANKVYRGVRQRHEGKWVAEILVPRNRTRLWFGTFGTTEDSALAYNRQAFKVRGEDAQLNFPHLFFGSEQSVSLGACFDGEVGGFSGEKCVGQDNVNSIDLSQYPPERIRKFSIIGHVDHSKSMLADRILELTGTIKEDLVERERGITVKAQTATMFHDHKFQGADGIDAHRPVGFLLNLVDTPGHVDFSYEVSRSLAVCQERVKAQLKSMFDLDPNDALLTSAKTGQGLEHVLPAVIERMPPPTGNCNSPLRMLLFDSYYNEYKGVICHVAVFDGTLLKGDKISSAATGQSYEVLDVGIMHPALTPTGVLLTGQVGYVVSGMRSTKETHVGDTLHQSWSIAEPLPGFKPVEHMVFSGVYPIVGSDFEALNHAIERLTCNDASVSVTKESSTALGLGFRCGFLGLLHMDVFHQHLEQEYGAHCISTVPTVPYVFEYSDGRYQASDLVKLDNLLNGQPVDAMAAIVHKLKAQRVAHDLVEKLKKFIDRQQFEVPIQAAIGSKVIAREMKDVVVVRCEGGGDVNRKRKLLEKQKDGKKRMKRVGSVDTLQEAFHQLFTVS
ncbi:hypothetical protein RHSIM_RhsimUnG0056000 [Rhododendron simsii]|uniref:Ribosomal back-translocase n=1 Tax=Rhododendron simsii TaxID=118357 RepID=A0A834L4V6_RHOSS|nr:hypothetical protein RHSIM_RhsimUnG0056000 [Rhododendron simsii]